MGDLLFLFGAAGEGRAVTSQHQVRGSHSVVLGEGWYRKEGRKRDKALGFCNPQLPSLCAKGTGTPCLAGFAGVFPRNSHPEH